MHDFFKTFPVCTNRRRAIDALHAAYSILLATRQQLLAMQHYISESHYARTPLHACFPGLKGAYRLLSYVKIQQLLLWHTLQRLELHGRMLGTLKSLYSNSILRMAVEGGTR